MSESKNSLISNTNIEINDEMNIKQVKEMLILILKFISFCILVLVLIIQFECLLDFIIKLLTNNNKLFMYTILFLIHIILLRFFVQSFLFILQSPILKSFCFYSIACNHLRELLEVSNEFIQLYKNLKKQKNTFYGNQKLLMDEICNIINIYMNFYKDIKTNDKLSKNQNELYEKLCSWMNNYIEYKNKNNNNNTELNIENKDNDNNLDDKKTFIYYLRKMKDDSNDILKILDNFICFSNQSFSIKKLYNILINNSFSSLNQYSYIFNQKFNNKFQTFITSDNTIIDYTIITYNKLNIMYKNMNKNKNEKIINNNLLIFCNPNGMIYQLFTPEKFLFLLEGGCDVLLWNYRGYGYSTGHATFKNSKTDIIELFDYIKKKNRYQKYGVFGYSVGGGSATFLAQNRSLDILICDRNYTSITKIARTFWIFGEILYYLQKLLHFKYEYNVSEFMNSKNKKIYKIVLSDPDDEIIPNYASIKSGISEYIIRQYCIENKLKKTEDILELFLNIENNSNQKKKFIDSLLYITDILIEFNKNPFKDLKNKKTQSNKNKENVDNTLLLNINENNELNKRNFKKRLVDTIIKFFKCFNYSSENLESILEIDEKRLKKLHIITYFNNFFIWGTISYKKLNVDGFKNPFDIKNNIFYLNKAIEDLNKFLDDKFIKSMIGEEENRKKYNAILTIKNCLKIFKNKNEFLNSNKNVNIGSLIRLNCGHNGLYSEIDEKNLIDILKDVGFIKYN